MGSQLSRAKYKVAPAVAAPSDDPRGEKAAKVNTKKQSNRYADMMTMASAEPTKAARRRYTTLNPHPGFRAAVARAAITSKISKAASKARASSVKKAEDHPAAAPSGQRQTTEAAPPRWNCDEFAPASDMKQIVRGEGGQPHGASRPTTAAAEAGKIVSPKRPASMAFSSSDTLHSSGGRSEATKPRQKVPALWNRAVERAAERAADVLPEYGTPPPDYNVVGRRSIGRRSSRSSERSSLSMHESPSDAGSSSHVGAESVVSGRSRSPAASGSGRALAAASAAQKRAIEAERLPGMPESPEEVARSNWTKVQHWLRTSVQRDGSQPATPTSDSRTADTADAALVPPSPLGDESDGDDISPVPADYSTILDAAGRVPKGGQRNAYMHAVRKQTAERRRARSSNSGSSSNRSDPMDTDRSHSTVNSAATGDSKDSHVSFSTWITASSNTAAAAQTEWKATAAINRWRLKKRPELPRLHIENPPGEPSQSGREAVRKVESLRAQQQQPSKQKLESRWGAVQRHLNPLASTRPAIHDVMLARRRIEEEAASSTGEAVGEAAGAGSAGRDGGYKMHSVVQSLRMAHAVVSGTKKPKKTPQEVASMAQAFRARHK